MRAVLKAVGRAVTSVLLVCGYRLLSGRKRKVHVEVVAIYYGML